MTDATTDSLEARRELADAARRLIDAAVRTGAPAGRIAAAARHVEEAVEALRVDLRSGPYTPDPAAMGTDATPFPFNPVVGPANPLAPPVTFEARDGLVVGTVELGLAHEGPPGYAHGGITCMILDHALGTASLTAGTHGMTANLSIDYRAPTPLNTELRIEARCRGAEGRKIHADGRILADGQVCVEAEGLFLQVTPDQARDIFAGIGATDPSG